MAVDETLTQRLRAAIGALEGVTETRLMGGACFMLNGNMLCCADRTKNGEGRFMFRVGKDNEREALGRPGAAVVAMGGREMRGFIFVDESACDARALKRWASLARRYVDALPPK